MNSRFPAILVALLAGLLVSARANASPFDVYGAGARGGATASAQTASPQGAASLAYNVAGLAQALPGVSIGVLATFGHADVVLTDRPDGYDVPDIGESKALPTSQTSNARQDTSLDNPLFGLTIGAVAPILVDDLKFGLLIFLPMPSPVTLVTAYPDERERLFSNQLHFERIGTKVHRFDLNVGLAYAVTDWLSFGLGASYLPGFDVFTDVYVPDPGDQSNVDVNADIETQNAFGMLAGARVNLPAGFVVGASFRDAVVLRVNNENTLQIRGVSGGEPIEQASTWTPVFSPARIAGGLAWTKDKTTLSLDGRYTLWSDYRDAQGVVAGFSDTFSERGAVEYAYAPGTRLRLGAGWEPTPVGPQTGRTNYVDNSRIVTSLGAGHDLTGFGYAFTVDWYLRFQWMLPRQQQKEVLDDYPDCADGVDRLCDEVPDDLVDPSTGQPFPAAQGLQTGNPGFPGYASGGWFGSVGVELSY